MNPQETPTPPSRDQSPKPLWNSPSDDSPANTTPTPVSAVVSPAPRKKRLLIAAVIAGITVLLGGAVAAAYFGYVLPNQPQNILHAALVNEFTPGKVKTETFHGTVTIKSQDGEDVVGTFKGGIDKSGPFKIAGNVTIDDIKATLDLQSPDAKKIYLRLGGLETLTETDGEGSALALVAPLLTVVNNQWLEIGGDLLKESGTGVDASKVLKLSDADMQKITDAYRQHRFLIVKEKLADQTIAGKPSHHLRVVLDKQQLKSFANSVHAAKLDAIDLTADQMKEFMTSVDKVDFNTYPIDVWVSKADKLIDQISMTTKDNKHSTSVVYTIDDWNKAVTVEKPAGSKPIEEFLVELYGGEGADVDALMGVQSGQSGTGISL